MNSLFYKVKSTLIDTLTRCHPMLWQSERRLSPHSIYTRSCISPQGGYCYFRIPKCANSTIVKTLAFHDPSIGLRPDDIGGEAAKASFAHLLNAGVWFPEQLLRRYFCFTFVRDPYVRALSAYLDKGFKVEVPLNCFADFLGYLENGGLYSNAHWAPQVSLIPVPVRRLDFIGKVETIDADLDTVGRRIFGDANWRGQVAKQTERQGSANRLAEYYDESLRQRVFALYRADFETLGYSTDLPTLGQA